MFDKQGRRGRESQLELTDALGTRPYEMQLPEYPATKLQPVYRVGAELAQVANVDPTAGTFSANMFLHCATDRGEEHPCVTVSGVMLPNVASVAADVLLAADERGAIRGISASFYAEYDLSRYPFDEHLLTAELLTPVSQDGVVVLDKAQFRVGDGDTVARGWRVQEVFQTMERSARVGKDAAWVGQHGVGRRAVRVSVKVRRVASGLIVSIVAPIIAVGLALLVVSGRLGSMESKRALAQGGFLALVGLGVAYLSVRPVTNRATALDWLFLVTLLLALFRCVVLEASAESRGCGLRLAWPSLSVAYIGFLLLYVAPLAV